MGPIAIHVASATVGIVTIPAVFLVAEELFVDDEGLLGKFGGVTAALATALSFWHLVWSRYGVRAILTPLFASLTMCFLLRGLRHMRWFAFVGCGTILGLGMYTYQASYLLPLLVVVAFAFTVWRNRIWSRKTVLYLALLVLTALLIFSPLGIYYLTHPDSSLERVRQVHVFQGTDVPGTLLRQLTSTLLTFGIKGDKRPTTNLPGRPALNPFLFAAFVLGMIITLWRIKQPPSFTLLAWMGVMCLPGVVVQFGATAKRIIGSLPATMILIAVGPLVPLDWVWKWTGRQVRSKRIATVVLAALSLVVLAGFLYSGILTYQDYFVTWGEDPDLFTHFEAGLVAIGQYIASLPEEERIYISPVYVGHPSIVYNSRGRSGVKGYHGKYCLVLPYQAERGTTYIIVSGEDKQSLDRLEAYLPQGMAYADGPMHYQEPYFRSYHVPAGARANIAPTYRLEATWAGRIQLIGYDVAYDKQEGQVAIRLYYRALRAMDTDYTVFVQLIGPKNPETGSLLWSQHDSEPCRRYRPTSTWDTDEILIDDFGLVVPVDCVVGDAYEAIMGVYNWRTLERLTVSDTNGQLLGDYLVLQRLVFGP